MTRSKKNNPAVLVGLQYRGRLSLGENRTRLGPAAFHWSIIIRIPTHQQQFHRFDVTDGIVMNEAGTEDLNPRREWVFRHQASSTFAEIPRYLGAVEIGTLLPPSTTPDGAEAFFKALPLPRTDADPEENCVSWVCDAARALQEAGRSSGQFEVEDFMDFALHHADERIKDFTSQSDIVEYCPQGQRNSVFQAILRRARSFKESS